MNHLICWSLGRWPWLRNWTFSGTFVETTWGVIKKKWVRTRLSSRFYLPNKTVILGRYRIAVRRYRIQKQALDIWRGRWLIQCKVPRNAYLLTIAISLVSELFLNCRCESLNRRETETSVWQTAAAHHSCGVIQKLTESVPSHDDYFRAVWRRI